VRSDNIIILIIVITITITITIAISIMATMPPKEKKAAAPAVLAYVTQGKTEHMAFIVDPTDGSDLSKLGFRNFN
jgi:flagellar basal body-associated protein FliL